MLFVNGIRVNDRNNCQSSNHTYYSGSVVKTKKSGKVNEPDITADFMPYDRIIARLLSAGKSQDREAFISVLTFACRQVQSPVRL